MGFTLEMLSNEPIMIVTGKGALTVQDFNGMFAESRKILAGMKAPIYRIVDLSESTTSFMELIRLTQIATKGVEGSTTDSRIKQAAPVPQGGPIRSGVPCLSLDEGNGGSRRGGRGV